MKKGKNNDMTDEIQAIIGKIPPAIVRYGNGIILIILLLSLSVCYLIPVRETQSVSLFLRKAADSTYSAEAIVPSDEYGCLSVGQRVQISLDSYPDSQYGYMYGKISFMDSVMTGKGYKIKIQVPFNQPSFSSDKRLKELSGTGKIIVKEYRLIHKIFGYPK